MKRLLDSRNLGSQSPPPPVIHTDTASLAPGGGQIHEPPPPGPRPPRALAPLSPPEAHGGPVSGKSKLKPLHWNKQTRAMQGTLWKEFQRDREGQSAPPEFDTAELEELFSDVAPKTVDSKEAEKKCPEKVHLIDPSRANSVEIMLTKVKMPLSNMTHAILAMDDKILSVDQLESILKWIPTREEMAKLKNYIMETDMRMSKCEKYLVELMKVPRMESKVMIFLFKVQFNISFFQLAKFKKNLNIIHSACHEVESSIKLIQILKKILYFGNTLNLKSPQGAEVGFKLDTLLKLVTKQALNGKITLMHCLCKVLASESPDLLDFHVDLVNVEAASKRLKEFIGFAEPEVTSVTIFYQVAVRNTYKLALHLGEDPASCPFEQGGLKERLDHRHHPPYLHPHHHPEESRPCNSWDTYTSPPSSPYTSLCAPQSIWKALCDDLGLLGGYPGRGYEPGPPSELPRPPGRLGGGLGRGHRGVGPAVRNSNLNPLFSFKVTRAVKGSLWEEIKKFGEGQSSPPEFDHSELETYFSNAPKKVVSKEAEKKKFVSTKPEQVQLIDMRRANNTLIMLTKVKMEYPQIVEAILTMNDKHLDANQLENILKFCPTKEEIEKLQNYQGDKNMLGKCEVVAIVQYFLELMRVPRVESKVNCFLFKIQFNTQLEKFKKSLNTVNSACDEVRKSIKLRDVIKRILYLADTLNWGTARGAEAGFNLDSLMKLVDTRSSISKMNLMHYLCKVFAAKAPALLDFPEDLGSLKAATKGLKEFISFAEAEVTIVTDLYTVARRKAYGLAIYIGAGPAQCHFEQAIQTLHNFVRLYQKCREDVHQEHDDHENKRKQADQMV
ncbi:formin-like protein 20 [Tanacetum coccineum]